jgi:hypothetical protein
MLKRIHFRHCFLKSEMQGVALGLTLCFADLLGNGVGNFVSNSYRHKAAKSQKTQKPLRKPQ